MASNRNEILMAWIDQGDTVPQAAKQGVESLIRDPEGLLFAPGIVDQLLPADNLSLIFIEHFKDMELQRR